MSIWQNAERIYIAAVLATPEIIRQSSQSDRIADLLPLWRQIPLYRDSIPSVGFDLTKLPIITKREMRLGFPRNFLPANSSLDELLSNQVIELEHTSGTSEERLPVIFARGWWNEQESRALRLNDLVARVLDKHPDARRATLTAPSCNGLTCPTIWMSQAQRTIGDSLFVNLARIPFVLSEADQQRMADEIIAWSPQFLDLDPVHGVWFALFCERRGIRFPSVRFVICSYEFVSVVHRQILERVFSVPVFNLYGSTETGHLLMENGGDQMKASHSTAMLEIVESDRHGIGTLLVTTLSNDFMPLLRYRIGDLAQREEQPYGTDYIIHGRSRDALIAVDGSRVTTWQADQCFSGAERIAHYQLRQGSMNNVSLRYVSESCGVRIPELKQTLGRLERLLGTSITAEAVPTLLPEASGKFRLTCRILDTP